MGFTRQLELYFRAVRLDDNDTLAVAVLYDGTDVLVALRIEFSEASDSMPLLNSSSPEAWKY